MQKSRSVVLTLGGDGSLARDRDGVHYRQPARLVTAVDTTGAGDAFVGALAVTLAAGEPLPSWLGLGRWLPVSVQRHGAQSSYPTAAEVPHASSAPEYLTADLNAARRPNVGAAATLNRGAVALLIIGAPGGYAMLFVGNR